MNKDTFLKLLKEPSNISAEDLASLEDVMKNFPFCNAATILLAKGNSEKGSMFANQKIKRAALFSPSREVLKRIISTHIHTKTTLPQTNVLVEDCATIENLPEPQTENPEKEATQVKNIHSAIDEIYKSLAERSRIYENAPSNFVDSAKGNSVLNEMLNLKNTNFKVEESVKVEQESSLKFYVHNKEFGKEIRKASADLIAEYLAYRTIHTPIVPDLESQNDIINQFIESDHHIAKTIKATTTVANIDLAKKSTTEDFELVTENIANILVRQEKYKKAIEVFEKLILKYPNKSTYFAIRIETTKSLIKS